MTEKAFLLLADGSRFEGRAFGAHGTVYGHVLVRAGAVGDVQALTDPVHEGHILVETFPLIGNVGWISAEAESPRLTPAAYVVRKLTKQPSNYRAERPLEEVLQAQGVIGIQGIDTRALARKLRRDGAMAAVVTDAPESIDLEELRLYNPGPVLRASSEEPVHLISGRMEPMRLAVLDLGLSRRTRQALLDAGFDLDIYAYDRPATELLENDPDGLFISSGPGNPKDLEALLADVRLLRDSQRPLMAVGLGHQLFALAHGFQTGKIYHGQLGAGRPVRDVRTSRMRQVLKNSAYQVLADSVAEDVAGVLFDDPMTNTVEGLRYFTSPAWTLQFEPAKGDIYRSFYDVIKEARHALG